MFDRLLSLRFHLCELCEKVGKDSKHHQNFTDASESRFVCIVCGDIIWVLSRVCVIGVLVLLASGDQCKAEEEDESKVEYDVLPGSTQCTRKQNPSVRQEWKPGASAQLSLIIRSSWEQWWPILLTANLWHGIMPAKNDRGLLEQKRIMPLSAYQASCTDPHISDRLIAVYAGDFLVWQATSSCSKNILLHWLHYRKLPFLGQTKILNRSIYEGISKSAEMANNTKIPLAHWCAG